MKCTRFYVLWIYLLLWMVLYSANAQTQECGPSKADLVFVVDDSSSVQIKNFKNVRAFIQDVVRSLTIGPNAVQVGYVGFSNSVKHWFFFSDHTDKTSLIEAIGKVGFRTGGTDIAKALQEAYIQHFRGPNVGARDTAEKVLVLITDGNSPNTGSISQMIRDADIKILCVGLPGTVKLQQLIDIAGDSRNVLNVASFTKLEDIKENLIAKTCKATRPPNPCDAEPCLNNGECTADDESGGFSCSCPTFFTGTICEIEIDPCDPNPCRNGGFCTKLTSSISCQCTSKFEGKFCDDEKIPLPCDVSPCFNGGTCSNVEGSTVCRCLDGFGGLSCQSGGLIPTVVELGEKAKVLCHKSPNSPQPSLEIQGIDNQRVIMKDNQHAIIKTIEPEDIQGHLLCHYDSQSIKSTTSTILPVIVVEKKRQMFETVTKLTCRVFSKSKAVDVSIQPEDMNTVVNATNGLNVTNGVGNSGNAEPSYGVIEPGSVSIVVKKGANAMCTVKYKDKGIWSEQMNAPAEKPEEKKGFHGIPWIILGIILAAIIITPIVIYIVRRNKCCKTGKKGPGGRSKPDEEKGDEEEKKKLNAIVEESPKESDAKEKDMQPDETNMLDDDGEKKDIPPDEIKTPVEDDKIKKPIEENSHE